MVVISLSSGLLLISVFVAQCYAIYKIAYYAELTLISKLSLGLFDLNFQREHPKAFIEMTAHLLKQLIQGLYFTDGKSGLTRQNLQKAGIQTRCINLQGHIGVPPTFADPVKHDSEVQLLEAPDSLIKDGLMPKPSECGRLFRSPKHSINSL